MAFEFVSQLREEWLRCTVRVELLMAEHGLSREEVLSAARRDPVHCCTYVFRGKVTHVAVNPDGFQPNSPGHSYDDFGPKLEVQSTTRERRRRPLQEISASGSNARHRKKPPPQRRPKPRVEWDQMSQLHLELDEERTKVKAENERVAELA
ncbi:MAG: hypothetical protein ACFB14_12940, partial [Leptolyngbyaceae cyanobacterium]